MVYGLHVAAINLKGNIMSQLYLCIQRSSSEKRNNSDAPSPAQMQEMFTKFNAWKEKYQGKIVDMGGKLGGGSVVTSDTIVDGPFIEAKEVIGGYMIVKADSMAEAVEVAQNSPGTAMPGSSVEVREITVA